MGDLAIVHYVISLTPSEHEDLELAEWVSYIFGPVAAAVTKDSCKTDSIFSSSCLI
jgi:hypothetical protein